MMTASGKAASMSRVLKTPVLPGGSAYAYHFNGTGDFIKTPTNATFNMSAGNWTVEGWYWAAAVSSGNSRYMVFNMTNTFGVIPSGTAFVLNQFGGGNTMSTAASKLKLSQWQHIALVKNGTTFTLYIDGIAEASTTTAWPDNVNSNVSFFGNDGGFAGTALAAYGSNMRIVMGTALYTANFVPPVAPLLAVTNTKLLTLQENTIRDNSGLSTAMVTTGSPVLATVGYGTIT